MALGVLLGYPFGGILYAFSGKSAPFYIIAIMTFVILGNFKQFSNCSTDFMRDQVHNIATIFSTQSESIYSSSIALYEFAIFQPRNHIQRRKLYVPFVGSDNC